MKSAIITGASSGIGEALAYKMASKGYDLLLVARNEEKLRNISERIRSSYRTKAIYLKFDLQQSRNYEHIVNIALESLDGIGVLVNNAGVGINAKADEIELEDVERLFWTNILSHILLTKHVLGIMKQQEYGKIVNIISLIAFFPLKYWQLYTATKMAQEGFFKSLKLELKGTGIDVINVYPGRTKTQFFKRANIKENYRFMDSPEFVASKVMKAIEGRGSKEVFMHWWGWLLSKIHGFI